MNTLEGPSAKGLEQPKPSNSWGMRRVAFENPLEQVKYEIKKELREELVANFTEHLQEEMLAFRAHFNQVTLQEDLATANAPCSSSSNCVGPRVSFHDLCREVALLGSKLQAHIDQSSTALANFTEEMEWRRAHISVQAKDHRSNSGEERTSPETQAMSCDADRSPAKAGHEKHQGMHSSSSRPSGTSRPSNALARSVASQNQSRIAIDRAESQAFTKNLFLGGSMKIQPPPCIYSTPLLIKWCLYGRDSKSFLGNRIALNLLLTQWVALLGHYFLTLGFCFYFHKVTQDKISMMKPGDCMSKRTYLTLRILALLAFSLNCAVDWSETKDMAVWLIGLSVEKIHQPCLMIQITDTGERVWANGITTHQKLLFLVLIIIPKLAVAWLVCVVGLRYILLSDSDEELFLNCLAMLFVMDIDSIMYKVFTPEVIRVAMEDLPVIHIDRRAHPRFFVFDLVALPWLRALLLATIVAMAISLDCSVS